ncbi:MAG: M20 family metallopeptidase [Candidatus Competibacterales bacterium]
MDHTQAAHNQAIAWLADQRPAMIDLLEILVNIDSGSHHKVGVDAVGAEIERFLAGFDIPCQRIPHPRYGDAMEANLGPTTGEYVLLMGHRDTVFPVGTAAERPFRIEGSRAFGPGVADMKGGLVINSFVMAAFARAGGPPLPLRALYTGDEEIASPSSRPLIETAAKNARAVLNAEPGRVSGNVVTRRNGAAFITVEIEGRAAHAGGQHAEGISAIEEAARKITALHGLTDYAKGITVNVGLVQGGVTVNTVAPFARLDIDTRFPDETTMAESLAAIEAIVAQAFLPGTRSSEVERRIFLPVPTNPATEQLLWIYRRAAATVGFAVDGEYAKSSADSGFTYAVGTPTLCATGPVGHKAHTPDEYLELDTMVPRAQALAQTVGLLA